MQLGGIYINQIIYVDVLVVLNLFVNYFLLLSTSALIHIKVKILRLLLASSVGAIYSLSIFIPINNIFVSVLLKLLCSAIIVLSAFGFHSTKNFLRAYGAFFLSNFIFAGFMFAVWIFFKPNSMIYQSGTVYFDINAAALTFSTVVCYIISALISHILKRRAPDSHIVKITISINGTEVSGLALFDTGNTLKEPFSSYPVIICEYKLIHKIIPTNLDNILNNPNQYDISNSNIRLVNFNSIGGSGLLPAFKPDYIIIENGKEKRKRENVYIGIYKGILSNGEYNALVGNLFFEATEKGELTY